MTDMEMTLLRDSIADCGCREQEWLMGMAHVTLHMESVGTGEVHLDMGEWSSEKTFECADIGELAACAGRYIATLSQGD